MDERETQKRIMELLDLLRATASDKLSKSQQKKRLVGY